VIKSKTTSELLTTKDFISDLLSLRKVQKLEKTYINGTRKAIEYVNQNKVFVDYRFDGTATGRLSCAAYTAEKPMGVSFHTLPRETTNNIRSIFVAPEDHAFITVDYSNMELRILAHLSGDAEMIKAFKKGEDLHAYTASLLFNKDLSSVTTKERNISKSCSFLVVYGGGAFNLSELTGLPLSRAKFVVDTYKTVYPDVFKFMNHIHKFIQENKYAYTIFGRRRNLEDIISKDASVRHRVLRQGFNFVIQSAASDLLLCSLLGIVKDIQEKNMAARIVATVHDSIELVCPYEEIASLSEIVYGNMVNCFYANSKFGITLKVPLGIELIVGNSFGEGIEAKYDNMGCTINMDEVCDYFNVALPEKQYSSEVPF
tara:strand:+ start:16 stop:1131 length:1116 start_codon:yes stop_codon:yes gene_type:complete